MAVPQISPESSLGAIGKSLLRFLKPVLKVGPHRKITNILDQEDLLDRDIHHSYLAVDEENIREGDSSPAMDEHQVEQEEGEEKPEQNRVASLSAGSRRNGSGGGLGSGVINVKRDSSTPWVNVVIDLADSCEKGSASARAKLGASLYQSANGSGSALSKTSVGRMINIVTIIKDEADGGDEDQISATDVKEQEEQDETESSVRKKSIQKKSA